MNKDVVNNAVPTYKDNDASEVFVHDVKLVSAYVVI
jgi:hypothetical protein